MFTVWMYRQILFPRKLIIVMNLQVCLGKLNYIFVVYWLNSLITSLDILESWKSSAAEFYGILIVYLASSLPEHKLQLT